MDKKDLIFIATAAVTSGKFNHLTPNTEEAKKTVKDHFTVWHQLLSQLYDETA